MSAQSAQSTNSSKLVNEAGRVPVLANEARRMVLLDLATRFKGIDPEVDKRIDAAATRIAGLGVPMKSIPAMRKGAPRVPLYFAGGPGVGKTSLIRDAILQFCDITGLNYVENPPDDYVPQPNDFYYVTVNLSGKMNTSDFGGMPIRTQRAVRSELEVSAELKVRRKTSDVGEAMLADIDSRVRGIAGFAKDIEAVDTKSFDTGPLRSMEVTVFGDPAIAAEALAVAVRQVGEDAKSKGVGISTIPQGGAPAEDRISYRVSKGSDFARLTIHTPRTPEGPQAKEEYVAAMLPNLRFSLARQFRFSVFNFDDVANANAQVRNVLLEVAQSNRYSGVMDLGNALVTFTGNLGAEDNTNTMSQQSDAEVTRLRMFEVLDTPVDWALRTTEKYAADPNGDLHFASFVQRQGNQPGIFREPLGAARGKRGLPKANSRSLENAMTAAYPYFEMARTSGVNVMAMFDTIMREVAGAAGPRVAEAYGAHLRSMLTEAIPLAEGLIDSGKLDEAKFQKHSRNFIDSPAQDFGFRFASALADTVIERLNRFMDAEKAAGRAVTASSPELVKKLTKLSENMCVGLAAMQEQQSMANYCLSRLLSRLTNSPDFSALSANRLKVLQTPIIDALADGFNESLAKGHWQLESLDASDPVIKNFVSMLVGNREAHTLKQNKQAKQTAGAAAKP